VKLKPISLVKRPGKPGVRTTELVPTLHDVLFSNVKVVSALIEQNSPQDVKTSEEANPCIIVTRTADVALDTPTRRKFDTM
jgi:hypothetical protein